MNQDLAFHRQFLVRKSLHPLLFFEIGVHFVGLGILELSPPAASAS